jgi:hypothetical protein
MNVAQPLIHWVVEHRVLGQERTRIVDAAVAAGQIPATDQAASGRSEGHSSDSGWWSNQCARGNR